MGSHIHVVAAAGTSAVEGLAEELEEDISWLQVQQQHQPQYAAQQQHERQQPEGLQSVHSGEQQHGEPQQTQQHQQQEQESQSEKEQQQGRKAPHQWWWQRKQHEHGSDAARDDKPWPLPPLSVTKRAWEHASPVLLQVCWLVSIPASCVVLHAYQPLAVTA